MAYLTVEASVRTHPKFLAAGPEASWLWLCGLGYCQDGLTDGFIPDGAIDYLGVKRPRVLAEKLVTARLWEVCDGGWKMHDYLEHNKSADEIREIMRKKREVGRKGGRPRKQEHNHDGYPDRLTGQVKDDRNPTYRPTDLPSLPTVRPTDETCADAGSEEAREPLRLIVPESSAEPKPPTMQQRAGAFCQWYEDAHQRILGVGYMGTNGDYMKALALCERFTDEELRDAAVIWFGMQDTFAKTGTRTIPKFASRASDLVLRARAVRTA